MSDLHLRDGRIVIGASFGSVEEKEDGAVVVTMTAERMKLARWKLEELLQGPLFNWPWKVSPDLVCAGCGWETAVAGQHHPECLIGEEDL